MYNLKMFYKKGIRRISSLNFIIFMLFGFLFNRQLLSQQLTEKPVDTDIRNFREEVFVRTDRDIYITGEQVWLKVYTLNGLTQTPCDLSKVVYLEVLDKNNFPLKQLKIKTENSTGSSSFMLPDNISSGNYLVRAYTNWMKNFSTDQFFYKTIAVINPFESIDHIKLPGDLKNSDSTISITSGQSQSIILNDKGNQVIKRAVPYDGKRKINYTINIGKQEYLSREKVKIMISASDIAGNPVETNLSVSVAKSCVINSSELTSFYSIESKEGKIHRLDGPENIAELEGHLISGYLRLKTTDEPLKKTDLSLSFVGKTARCQFGKTDEQGEFNFVVKEPGQNEIVIQPLSPDISGYYVELNQPFSSTFSKFKPVTFYLDSSRLNEINKVIIGMQINNIYEPYRQHGSDASKTIIPDFYGKPENTINMADYIELTSLKEVVKELLPNVYTLKQNGKHDFKLINKFRGQPFENKPLILVDGVPVYDFEKVLSINSKEIERADIINTRYFISENVFDGIVSFITKKGNLSAMEFDNSIFRQVYEGCQVQSNFYSPDYSAGELKNNRIPDYRNTLYWKPDLHTGKDGKTEIDFFTSDESSDYTIIVEGISSDGKKGFSSASLKVK
jgi:MG2 domain